MLHFGSFRLTTEKYYQILHRLIELENNVEKKTHKDYRMLNKFVLMEFNVEGEVIKKLTKRGTQLRYVIIEELFNVIHTSHLETGHAGRDIMHLKIGEKYANVTKEQIQVYLGLCETCQLKKRKVRKSLVVKPLISSNLNSRCQVIQIFN